MRHLAALAVLAAVLSGCIPTRTSCAAVNASEAEILEEWRDNRGEALRAGASPADDDSGVSDFDAAYDRYLRMEERRIENQRRAEKIAEARARADYHAIEQLAILAEHHPRCFSVEERVKIERQYRRWSRTYIED